MPKEHVEQMRAYITEQLSALPDVRSIPMMGGTIFYYKERIIGGTYPADFFVKDVPAARAAMPDSVPQPPLGGSGTPMLPCTILDDAPALCAMVKAMWPQLPERRPRPARKAGK